MKKYLLTLIILFTGIIAYSQREVPLNYNVKINGKLVVRDSLRVGENSVFTKNITADTVKYSALFPAIPPDSILVSNVLGDTVYDPYTNTSLRAGYQAGSNNKAVQNTFLGYQAGLNNIIGTVNTFAGYKAGYNNISDNNTAFGYQALYQTTNAAAQYNIAIGVNPLYSLTLGQENIAIGSNALYTNTVGGQNIAIGAVALQLNSLGSENIGLGYYSLQANLGSNNIAIGSTAGIANTFGEENIFIGRRAGYTNTVGNYNVYLGNYSGQTSIGDGNVFIGYSAGYNELGSNKLYIDNSNANYENALITGNFDSDSLYVNGTLNVSGNVLTNSKLGINNAGFFNQLGVTSTASSYNMFNFVDSRFNFNRSTYAEATDTCSYFYGYSPLGKPFMSVKGLTGNLLFDIDTVATVSVAGGGLRLSTNVTNATNKIARITCRHYTNSEEDMMLLTATSNNGTTGGISYGGNNSSFNATPFHRFFTAANATTLTGTLRFAIESNGDVEIVNGTNKNATFTSAGVVSFPRMAPAAKSILTIDATTGTLDVMAISTIDGNNTSATQDIVAANGITTAQVQGNGVLFIQSSTAGSCDISSNPQFAAGANGQRLTIIGVHDTKTVIIENGTGITSPATRTLGLGDNATYIYSTTTSTWIETAFTNN